MHPIIHIVNPKIQSIIVAIAYQHDICCRFITKKIEIKKLSIEGILRSNSHVSNYLNDLCHVEILTPSPMSVIDMSSYFQKKYKYKYNLQPFKK